MSHEVLYSIINDLVDISEPLEKKWEELARELELSDATILDIRDRASNPKDRLDRIYLYRVSGIDNFFYWEVYEAFGRMGKPDLQNNLIERLRIRYPA